MPEFVALSKKLKKYRKELEQNQMEFAAHCGVSTEILSLIEREKTDPKLSTLQKFAAYLGVTVSDLLEVDYN